MVRRVMVSTSSDIRDVLSERDSPRPLASNRSRHMHPGVVPDGLAIAMPTAEVMAAAWARSRMWASLLFFASPMIASSTLL